jgi:uncharacterized protein
MNAGVCKLKIHFPQSQSLKAKRSIIKSIIARLHNQFNISVAEVDDNDLWQIATLGLSCVSNSHNHVDETISSAMNYISQNYPEVEIIEHDTEIMQGF